VFLPFAAAARLVEEIVLIPSSLFLVVFPFFSFPVPLYEFLSSSLFSPCAKPNNFAVYVFGPPFLDL